MSELDETKRERQARDIFLCAVEIAPPEAQSTFLDDVCLTDTALRSRVTELLGSHRLDTFMETPAADLLPNAGQPGDRIGRYKLREKIGEGGCGVVYVADQEEPVRRKVALKIIKLGMDTRSVVARFEAERQALAMMDHPNIAKVHDAGATETGRPYFVMELVRGIKITDYCAQNQLSTRERLELFVKVCQAVRHAHQKGIIHRDIKPSNILVVTNDGAPVPKIIDFGIAKATEGRLTDATVYADLHQFIGTPAYMSPEQAAIASQDIDPRSDIYSLGVLLYELLTGHTPFDSRELMSLGADELRRTIREKEPMRPSMRLRQQASVRSVERGERQERKERGASSIKRSPFDAPRSTLPTDLDWIVMKCLEKDRARRYETASALARDIERHLKHKPVSAVAPTLAYRTTKFLRRHRTALATVVAFVVLLTLATTLGLLQARRAAQAQRDRSNVQWALETAMPQIEHLLSKDEAEKAFKLIEQVRPFVGDNPAFQALAQSATTSVSIETSPPGAQVFIRDYSDSDLKWGPIGRTPLVAIKVPQGFKRWRIEAPGYEIAEGAFLARFQPVELRVHLDKIGSVPAGMRRIPGQLSEAERELTGWYKPQLEFLDLESLPFLKLTDFVLDKYEVGNRQFKEFVDAGGYLKPDYWKERFVTNGVEITWQEAMKLFVDQTGKPGPGTWTNESFPPGQDDYPVGGVSWYEAAAYARFAGKRLPTIYHWSLAAFWTLASNAREVDSGYLIPLSNFGKSGPAPAGSSQAMTSRGIYDMAGNLKEWCFNEMTDGDRVIAGASWDEPTYLFGVADKYPPLFRASNFGFRCMNPIAVDGLWEQAALQVKHFPAALPRNKKPCSDEMFDAYRRLYQYQKSDLQPSVDSVEDLSIYTRREKVSFNAAYGTERVIVYIYLPRQGKPPFQSVIRWPGSDALHLKSVTGTVFDSVDQYERTTQSGRACILPILRGTFERKDLADKQAKATQLEKGIMWIKDFERTLDYLETRPQDFDTNKIAYHGYSWGAGMGAVVPAIETRIKAAVMISGGLRDDDPAEFSPINFAPRVKIPFLMQNGRYDSINSLDSGQKAWIALFGTPEKDKHHKIYETGHAVWLKNEAAKDEEDFLNEYLGRAK